MTVINAYRANNQSCVATGTMLSKALMSIMHSDGAENSAALLMQWIILSACRVSEAQNAKLSEIDLVRMTWTIPAERRKDRREHIIPITAPMAELLCKAVKQQSGSPTGYLFGMPGSVRLAAMPSIRAAFKHWALEEAKCSPELVRAQIGYQPSPVERAHLRKSDLQCRRHMMQAWAAHLMGAEQQEGHTITGVVGRKSGDRA